MSAPMSRRERKKRQTREQLLLAAWHHFRDKGFDDTTVEEITDSADVAKGTFFNYFSSKEEVLAALATWGLRHLFKQIDPAHGGPDSPLEQLGMLLGEVAVNIVGNGRFGQRMLAEYWQRHAQLEEPGTSLWHKVVDLVKAAQGRGEIRPDADPRLVARLLLASCIYGDELADQPRAKADQSIHLLLSGLAGPAWRE